MPVVADEENEYGYQPEDRHMVQAFLKGVRPSENFDDGLNVTELLMAAYMSAERDKVLPFPPPGLAGFIPAVARGRWNPKKDGSASKGP
ncbi:MAG: gfo/Idh/MocA family oxidoreductase, partial [Candidatus Aminicenantes bacterium]|nr:gfo/Idh/MocA family oxidoreductase [Candidatus Aminicenantes bacterium]